MVISQAAGARRTWQDKAARAVLAGFAATGAMTATLLLAYTFMANLALVLPRTPIRDWFWAMTNNAVVDVTRQALALGVMVHFTIGVTLALIYAFFAEHHLPGPDWQRGALFALVPWVLSLVVLLPLLGGGMLGLELGAGPLPVIGNLVLHLVYGATLGMIYGRVGDIEDRRGAGLDRTAVWSGQQARTEQRYESGAAAGLLLGGVFGSMLGAAFGAGLDRLTPGMPDLDPWTYGVAGLFLGAAFGLLVGSFAGMSPQPGEHRAAAVRTIERRRHHHARLQAARRRTARRDAQRAA